MSKQIILTEAQEAHTLVAYLRIKGYRFAHIPNETGGSFEARRRAIRVKREGGAKGFPDYLVWIDGKMYVIELKRVKGSRISPEQQDWIDFFNSIGVSAKICKGAEEAILFLQS